MEKAVYVMNEKGRLVQVGIQSDLQQVQESPSLSSCPILTSDNKYSLVSEQCELQKAKGSPNLPSCSTFIWDHKSTLLLTNSYMEFKKDFRDPKIKKKNVWVKIKNKFEPFGYVVDEETLNRKWRNLKKTYTSIKDNIKKTGRGRMTWEHFEVFEDIYRDDKTVNLPRIISSSVTSPVEPLYVNTLDSSDSEVPLLTPVNNGNSNTSDTVITPLRSTSSNKSKSGAYYLRKRLADIEEKRVEEIKMLRLSIEKSNAIQEERNELLRKFLDK